MAEEKTNSTRDNIKAVDSGRINVTIEPEEPKNFNKSLKQIQDEATNLSRMSEQGIVNEITGSAVVVRTDGQINLTPSKYAALRLNPAGKIIDQSMESETISNRKKFTVDELVVNEHKLNPQLWELADMRAQKLLINQNVTVGNLTIDGHVLVKAWEPNLKRYMLIRRPWRGPIFGPLLNVPEINTALQVDDPLKVNEDILALSEKGYQVNGIIHDAKSLIGKDGTDRSGSAGRNMDAMSGVASSGSGGGASASVVNVGKAPGKGAENIPKGQSPQWAIDMCIRCSKGCGIPADWLYAQFRNESGNFSRPCAQHNYGGMSSPSGGWMSFDSPDEFADYMAKVLPRWVGSDGKSTTQAKTMKEYVIALQTDPSPYCYEPPGVDDYYNKMLRMLGNQGTVID